MRIGIVVHDCNNEYFQLFFDGANKFCVDHNADLLIIIAGAPNWQEEDFGYHDWFLTKFINKENLDGVIVMTGTICHYVDLKTIQKIIKSFRPLPLVSLNVEVPGVPSVIVNPKKSFTYLVEHLIKVHGFRKFAFLTTGTTSWEIRERYELFLNVLRKYSIEFDENNLFHGSYTFYSAEKAVLSKIKSRKDINFEALISVTDEMAYGAISALQKLGASVPEDVVVTGFDITTISKISKPTLTSVNQHLFRQGEICAEMVYRQINGEKNPDVYIIDPSCCLRQSCGCIEMGDSVNNSVDEEGKFIKNSMVTPFNTTIEYLGLREQIQMVQTQLNKVQGNLSLEELSMEIKGDFLSLGITKAAVCLYEKPVKQEKNNLKKTPDKARVYFALDEDNPAVEANWNSYFDCRKSMLPKSLHSILSGKINIMSLYHGEYLYGYMIFRHGSLESFIYTLFCSVVAKSICSAYEVSKRRDENLLLSKKNTDLSILSNTDELTGIFNRRGFMKVAQNELKAAVEAHKNGLVIFGDIDGLKRINDTYGHDAGDRAILAEVKLLKKAFREADTIGRLGGDEFGILSISLSLELFENLKLRLAGFCDEWNRTSGEPFKLSISLGAVEFSKHEKNLEKLLKLADAEQYMEKEEHKKNIK